MEPQQSLQPSGCDPTDDDPDQDADPPPPDSSPAILDSALSLVAQPLACAAARVASSYPLALPVDDLNDFNVDLSWAGTDLDSLFLTDTQYIQLGDDPPAPSPTPTPPFGESLHPDASASATHPRNLGASVTAATDPIPESQPHTKTPSTATPIPSHPSTQNAPPTPCRPRPSPVTQKRTRQRLNQPPIKHNAIPIAPRTVSKPKHLPDLKLKSAPPTPRSMQAQSSPLDTTRPKSIPAVHPPDRSPASVSRESGLAQNPANPVTHFPLGLSPHPIIPLMNMYPLQHHQSVLQPSPPVLSPAAPNTPDSKVLRPPNSSNASDTKKMRLADAQSRPLGSHQRPQQAMPQQPFLSPAMQVMPQGVVPYDASIMPFFQMAQQVYAAAAAGYPQGVIPPMPPGSPNIPPTIFKPFGANSAPPVQPENAQNVPTSAADAAVTIPSVQQPSRQQSKATNGPVVLQEGGTQVLVPQQKAARLERHPVLGRLQLKSPTKPQVATSSGMHNRIGSDTQTPSGEPQKKMLLAPNRGAASSSRAGSSSVSSRDGGQRPQKKRLVWTPELHERFVKAINAVGLSQTVPKTLVTIMNVDGLTTEHVKSHLQKYRNSLRKEAAEEARDWNRGPGPSAGPHNPRLGTPGASGASVIRAAPAGAASGSAPNRAERQSSTMMANEGGLQSLPVLPNRISAFGGPMPGVMQPTLNALSAPTETPISSHQPSRPPGPTAVRSSRQAGPFQGTADGSGAVVQPSESPSAVKQRSDQDPMLVDDASFALENVNNSAPDSGVDNLSQSAPNAVITEEGRDVAPAAAPVAPAGRRVTPVANPVVPAANRVAPVVGPALGPAVGPATGSFAKAQNEDIMEGTDPVGTEDPHAPDGDANAEEGMGLVADIAAGDIDDPNATSTPSPVVGNPPSANQDNRDLELELMKERTLQMQLQVQMMVHRTIALEKKLEEVHSSLHVEGSGTADASRRSAVGRESRNGGQSRDVAMEDADDATAAGPADTARPAEAPGIPIRKLGEHDRGDGVNERSWKKRKSNPSGNDGQSEVKALLHEQMGLKKRLDAASVMIDKHLRQDGGENTGSDERVGQGQGELESSPNEDVGKASEVERDGAQNQGSTQRRDMDADVNMDENS